jgi:hypothetical protein
MTGHVRIRWIASVAATIAVSMAARAQVVPTTAAPPGPRTGMIAGQVVDAGSGAPIGEAIVQMTLPKYFDDPAAPRDRVMTDAEGRFFFADLPAGEYYLEAAKEGYAPGRYGQRQPWAQSQLVPLAEGERLADVALRVWKYGAIAGTVVDEAGEPVVGVAVRALIRNVIGGRVQYGNMQLIPELVPSAITDDRGMFRLSQLIPGTYVVAVPYTHTTLPAAYLEHQDVDLRNELFFAGIREMTLLGTPLTQQVGGSALMTANRAPIPPPPASDGRMAVYRTTYYPGEATAGAAAPIAVGVGEERTGIAIALRPERGVRVSGRLVTPDGAPPPPTPIKLLGSAMTGVVTARVPTGPDHVGLETVTGMSDEAGRFTLLGVPAGEYVLAHAAMYLNRAVEQGMRAYWISEPLTVENEDLDVTVQVRPALRVEGRMEFRGAGGQTGRPPGVAGVTFETPYGEPGGFFASVVRDSASFSTVAAGGRYIARPHQTGWFVQSVAVAGKDVTDRVFDLRSDVSMVVTFTDRPSKVTGTVTDAQGAASPTAMVLAFPVDRALWSGYGTSPRNVRSALTSRTGVYTFDHLPPGDYHVIAVMPAEADDWQDPARLEALAADAAKLTVAAGDSTKTLDLRLKAIQ